MTTADGSTERIVLLGSAGEPVGTADEGTAHGRSTPYHLAFSCYAFNSENRLLVTQRGWGKRACPEGWTNTCCGRPAAEEDVRVAVVRRMMQELGLVAQRIRRVLPSFSYRAEQDGTVEHELCPVFLCRTSGTPTLNPSDVAACAWWPWEEFVDAASSVDLSPWARLQVVALREIGEPGWYLTDTGNSATRP